jgi:hypothetical protein
MTTLEDLYYGNIHPYERDMKKTGRESALLRLAVKNENDLLATLTEQQKEIFQKCKDSESEMHCAFELRSFIEGFRLGMKLTAEGMYCTEETDED